MQPIRRPRWRPNRRFPWTVAIISAALLTAVGLSQSHHPSSVEASQRPVVVGRNRAASPVQKLVGPATATLPGTPVPTALPFPIGENSGVLWNLTTGQLLWAYHPYLQEPYASTTKLMTIYLALGHLSLTRRVSISPQAAGTSGSDIRMAVNDQFTVRQLLYGLMMASANDSAVELAQVEAGSVPAFVAQMNQTAKSLGMTNTHYADPDGLSPRSEGSAWDLSIIARADLANPLFRKIVRTKIISLPYNPVVRNLNGLLFMDPSVIGVKTGWTTQAGFNLVFAATRPVDGKPVTLLGVIMHGQAGFPPEYQDAEKILNWGFNRVKAGSTSEP